MARVRTFFDTEYNQLGEIMLDPGREIGDLVRVKLDGSERVVVRRKDGLVPLDDEARQLLGR